MDSMIQQLMGKITFLFVVLIIQAACCGAVKPGRKELRDITCNSLDASGTGQWGLDRIDQREDIYILNNKQKYTMGTHDDGHGVDIYVISTGVDRCHHELDKGIRHGYVRPGLAEGDLSGHGTHLAGIAISNSWGVAKRATVVSVQVENQPGEASVSDIIQAIDWIQSDHAAKPAGAKSVVLLPFSLSQSQALDDAVTSLASEYMTVVAAAGDDGQDACNFSPGNLTSVITVAATNRNDRAAETNNYGNCVDLFAPGVEVRSTMPGGSSAMTTGSAMAAAFVAGIAARHKSDPSFSPSSGYKNWIIDRATTDAIRYPVNSTQESSPNRIAYIGCSSTPGSGDSWHIVPLTELYALIILGSFFDIFTGW